MRYRVIENLLKEKIGLDPESIGSSSISRVIERRLTESGYDDLDEYIKTLATSENELNALIEAIVVPETWFFRDRRPFILLQDYVKDNWLRNNSDDQSTLRILSIPCSTGEEPYSIAMVLWDLGYPQSRCQIDAVDISAVSLAYARRGIYREHSFRGDEMDIRYRYFSKENKHYKLDRDICGMVNYFQGNILDAESFPVRGPYHIIFCRNLLIYFDRSDQKRAIASLHRLLATDGLLFIGHAEASQALNELFTSLKYQGAFAYRKSCADDLRIQKNQQRRPKTGKRKIKDAGSTRNKNLPVPTPPQQIAKHDDQQGQPHPAVFIEQLDTIRKLADEGRLSEALLSCEKYIRVHGDEAAAYYLMGVLYDADGDANLATDMFRKAIYLDPHHHEALIHLALHAERSGNKTASDNLKRRAQRVAEANKTTMKRQINVK